MTRQILAYVFCLTASLSMAQVQDDKKQEVYGEFNYGQKRGGEEWVQAVYVTEPPYRSEVKGDTEIKIRVVGLDSARALCWQQPTDKNPNPWGHDELLTPDGITLDAEGRGSFVFPADQYPNGPVNVRIFAISKDGKRDMVWLQSARRPTRRQRKRPR